jgi:tRNA (guanine-N7-)-methyltransferase
MPNFHTKTYSTLKLPASFGQSSFEFIATSSRNETLVMATCSGQNFLLQVHKNRDGYLIKGDKITRPSQVALLQRALIDFRDLLGLDAHMSNIESKKQKSLKISPYIKKMDYFANEFVCDKEILVEVGFGSGRHLLHQAKKNPDKLIIGLEIHKPSIEQVLKQCELQEITNILVVDYDARVFLEFLDSNSVKQIFVHFPVPWDKKPHRRVISERFIKEAKRVLKPEGTLELRTDSDNYFEYSFFEFMKEPKTDLHVNKNRDLEISSKYEDRWKRQEKNIYDITMVEHEFSDAVAKIDRLKFDKNIDFKELKSRFEEKVLRGEDFFAHIEEIYEIDEDSGFIKVSFGGAQKNEHNYIHITKQSVVYLPDNVLATKDNINAHKLIEEILYGLCD